MLALRLSRPAAVAVLAAACSSSSPAPAPAPPGIPFGKTVLDTAFRSEGIAAFDVDKDGHVDLVTDQFWYAGPSFTPHAMRTPETFDPASTYSHCLGAYGDDLNGDGWTDVMIAPFPADEMYWYENPEGGGGRDMPWPRHLIAPALSATIETPIYEDLFGDGHRVLLMGNETLLELAWFSPPADPTQPWDLHPISAQGFPGAGRFQHGLGVGDVDGDGKRDVMTGYGWFQQTADHATWVFHAFSFGPSECSEMYAYDVDQDGLADVLCARPHDYGLHWFQQTRAGAGGAIDFVDHVVDATLSQMHALRMDDLDGDGVPELVSGKRFWAHGPTVDPGAGDPALLVYYAIRRAPGQAPVFERHTIDGDSGIGTQLTVADVDGDGKKDVAVSNKKGLFFLRQQ